MKKLKPFLRGIGLSSSETKTYIATLKVGSGTADDISHLVKLPRTTVKSILDRLTEKGFVLMQHGRKKHVYWIEDPEAVIAKEKTKLEAMEAVFSKINTEFYTSEKKPGVEVFDTRKSILTLMTRVISEMKKGEEILTFESPDAKNYEKIVTDEIRYAMLKQKVTKGIQTKSLVPWGEEKRINPRSLESGVQVRVLPQNFNFKTSIWIFKKSIVLFSGDHTLAIIITSKIMHDTFLNFFNFFWPASTDLQD